MPENYDDFDTAVDTSLGGGSSTPSDASQGSSDPNDPYQDFNDAVDQATGGGGGGGTPATDAELYKPWTTQGLPPEFPARPSAASRLGTWINAKAQERIRNPEGQQFWQGLNLKTVPQEIGLSLLPFLEAHHAFRQAYDVATGTPIEQAVPESQKFVGIEKQPIQKRLEVGIDTVMSMLFAKEAAKQIPALRPPLTPRGTDVPPVQAAPPPPMAAPEAPPASREVPGAPSAPAPATPEDAAAKEAAVQDLIYQGFDEPAARGSVERQTRVPGEATTPQPKFEVDDVVDAEEIHPRIVDAKQEPDGTWRALLDNDQAALLHPMDAEGATFRIGQIAGRSSIEGRSILSGKSPEIVEEELIGARAEAEQALKAKGKTTDVGTKARNLLDQRQAALDAADRLKETDPVTAGKIRRAAMEDYRQGLEQLYRPEEGGETNAIKPSDAQVETGGAALGVEEGAGGAVPETGSSDYAKRETQRAAPRRNVPGEKSQPASEAVAAEAPPENELYGQGLPKLEPFSKPPNPGERVIWRGKNLTVESVNHKTNVVHFAGGRKAPFTNRMKQPLPPFYEEAVHTVQKRLALPKDETLLRQGQEKGVYPKASELKTLYDNEHESIQSKYGAGPPGRKVLASANKAAFAGGTPEQNAAIARGVEGGGKPQGFVEGRSGELAENIDLIEGGTEQLPGGKLIREPAAAGAQPVKGKGESVAAAITKEAVTTPPIELNEPEIRPPTATERLAPRGKLSEAQMAQTVQDSFRNISQHGEPGEPPKVSELGHFQMIEGGRRAIQSGVDPDAALRSTLIPEDAKYAIAKAHAEDLRQAAHNADQAARKAPTKENKAEAQKAFSDYSNWYRYKLDAQAGKALALHPEMEVESFDPKNYTDLRAEMVRLHGEDFTPAQKRKADKLAEQLQKTFDDRNKALDKRSEDLRKLSPELSEKIDTTDQLYKNVANLLKDKFPCT